MSDPFALLGLPRRPYLEEAVIRAAFQQRARVIHPDAPGGDEEAFAILNEAQAILARPADRLRLLAGAAPLPGMPQDIALGFRVAAAMGKVETWRGKRSTGGNVLARALLAREAAPLQDELRQIAAALEVAALGLNARLRALDERWPDVAPAELAALAGEYVFLTRWSEQTREGRLTLKIAFG